MDVPLNAATVGTTIIWENTFAAASENGFLLGGPGVRLWKSSVEGGWASVSGLQL